MAYVPHGYDLVTVTKNASDVLDERANFIYERFKEKERQLNMPVWLGEWGAFFTNGEVIVLAIKQAIGLTVRNRFGNTNWSYGTGMEDQSFFQKAIIRPCIGYTNGELLGYNFDFERSVIVRGMEGS